jgi:hypothetical protein
MTGLSRTRCPREVGSSNPAEVGLEQVKVGPVGLGLGPHKVGLGRGRLRLGPGKLGLGTRWSV